VGAEKTIFYVHDSIIQASSKFFDNAMKGGWKESEERRVKLFDDDANTFSLYQDWLYSHQISTCKDVGGREGNEEYIELCKAYCLGEKLMDDNFKNAVVDAIIHKNATKASDGHHWYPVGKAIRYAYDGTPAGSPLRKLLVDFYAYQAVEGWLSDYTSVEEVPKEFLYDVTIATFRARGCINVSFPWGDSRQVKTRYHTHT